MRSLGLFIPAVLALTAGALLTEVGRAGGPNDASPVPGSAPSQSKQADEVIVPAAAPKAERQDDGVRAFLTRHCVGCHGNQRAEADLRLDRLRSDFTVEADREQWLAVLNRVRAGEMPPRSEPRPPADEVRRLSEWILRRAIAAESLQARPVLRRLNRVEYENTVRDLLDIEIELKELLPEDTSAQGFDNVGEALHVSAFLMERYLEAAEAALGVAIANRPQPPVLKKRLSLKDARQVRTTRERVYLEQDDALVMFSSSAWNRITVTGIYPPDRGRYRFRISAYGHQSMGKPVTYRIDAGPLLQGTKNHLVGYFRAAADEPTVAEWVDHLEARSTIRIAPYGLASAQQVNAVGAADYDGPGLAVQWIDVEGPLHESWPPESHRRLFGGLPQARASGSRLEVVSSEPRDDARRIVRDFARRAFRRPVTDEEIEPLLQLVESRLAEGYSFEQAVRVGLKGVLVSPQFLFLQERPGRLDDFALASRLSYFLWSTMPDDELLDLAEQGKLTGAGRDGVDEPRDDGEPPGRAASAALHAQVERMLKSPKASAFVENFVGQWLGLRDIDFTQPDRRMYPEYDELLREAMLQETLLFFQELLDGDLSLLNLVASDFTFLNQRLADHYGVPGVEGLPFRKVPLPPDSRRGGVLTMASVLKVTADGSTTSPILRGVWVLDRILGTPPNPPPAEVPSLEPDIRGAATVRDQLAKHRSLAACAVCHSRIDPPGFALESFDVIGGWRDHYRTMQRGEAVTVDGRRMAYFKGPPVDPADELPDGRRFANIDEFKQRLLEAPDQIARGLAGQLLVYATGRPPRTADQPEIEAIVGRLRENNFGLRALVHEIVQSEAFQNK